MRLQLDIPVSPQAAGEARRLVTDACGDLATQTELDNARLLTSELVTNAVRHALMSEGDVLTVVVDVSPGRAMISVRDRGPGFSPNPIGAPPFDLATGWGLTLVESLAEAWGVDQQPNGFSVWAELGLSK